MAADGARQRSHVTAQTAPPSLYVQPASSQKLLIAAVLGSLCLHFAVAASALTWGSALPEFGVLDAKTDAMSLAMTQSVVLESTLSLPTEAVSASSATMQQGAIQSADSQPQPLTAIEEVAVEQKPPSKVIKATEVPTKTVAPIEPPLDVLTGAGEPAEQLVAAAEKPLEEQVEPPTAKPDDTDPKKVEREKPAKKKPKQAQRQQSNRQTAGGATSRANTGTAAASGRVSASRGSMLSYAARVRAKVAREKPLVRGSRGTARVSFSVTGSGGLGYARVSRSSGSTQLDQAAVKAVRRAAPFGRPPAGVSATALRFSIPFYFR